MSISIKFSANLLWLKEIQNCTNKGTDPLQREDNHKIKNLLRSLKNFLLENDRTKIAQIDMKAFWHSADLSLYKIWYPGVGRGHKGGNCFYTCILKEIYRNETYGQFQSNLVQTILA
jgi:hypothetical protein